MFEFKKISTTKFLLMQLTLENKLYLTYSTKYTIKCILFYSIQNHDFDLSAYKFLWPVSADYILLTAHLINTLVVLRHLYMKRTNKNSSVVWDNNKSSVCIKP